MNKLKGFFSKRQKANPQPTTILSSSSNNNHNHMNEEENEISTTIQNNYEILLPPSDCYLFRNGQLCYPTTTMNDPSSLHVLESQIGHSHILLLTETNIIFASGWNSYGQYGSNPLPISPLRSNDLLLNSSSSSFSSNNSYLNNSEDNLFRVNPNQYTNYKIINIYSKFNYTYYLAIDNENNKQILLSSGWNNGNCLSHRKGSSDSSQSINKVYFDVTINNNNNNLNNNNNGDNLSPYLENEKILKVAVGGCHTLVLTQHLLTNEHFVYECGTNCHEAISVGRNLDNLTKSMIITNFIKNTCNDKSDITDIDSSFGASLIVSKSGRLYTIGSNCFTNGKNLQQIDNDRFDGELVVAAKERESRACVLTNYGNFFVITKSECKKYVGIVNDHFWISDVACFVQSVDGRIHELNSHEEISYEMKDYLTRINVNKDILKQLEFELKNFRMKFHSSYTVLHRKKPQNVLFFSKLRNFIVNYCEETNSEKNYFFDITITI
ncbi:hypothetical protein ABK040_005674 [Willaertia magna]